MKKIFADYIHNSYDDTNSPNYVDSFNYVDEFQYNSGDSINSYEGIFNENNQPQEYIFGQPALFFSQSTTANNLLHNDILSQNQNQEEVAKGNNENIIDKKKR